MPSACPSIRVFSNEPALCIRCPQPVPASGSSLMSQPSASGPEHWRFSFSTSPSREHSGLISCQADWFHVLAAQGALGSPPQHSSSKASALLCSVFFIVQLSRPYTTPGKTTDLTLWTFVGKVSLLFNMLSRFILAFLLRSKHLLTSWLQSTNYSDLGNQENKVCYCVCFPFYLP